MVDHLSIHGISNKQKNKAIDLFCGCGGLSLGLTKAGFDVIAGVEIDPLAAATYRTNHKRTELFQSDIREIDPLRLMTDLKLRPGELSLLSGCPPCQGFSTLRTGNGSKKMDEPMNDLVFEFVRFARYLEPKAIMMENVPGLAKDSRIFSIIIQLEKLGYRCKFKVLDASKYGVPQRRKRMILLGMRGSNPRFANEIKITKTVRQVLSKLGEPGNTGDPLHDYEVNRSLRIKELISKVPKDGGSRNELPSSLQLACHQKCDGYKDTYGRMSWSKPAPTITGGCINPSKGRFLHPEEDRAITLREAALIQGFPASYKFDMSRGLYATAQIIGNAFPPAFARIHASVLLEDINKNVKTSN